MPVVNGLALKNSIFASDFGGKQLTDYLFNDLRRIGYTELLNNEKDKETIARDIKHKICYVSTDFDYESNYVSSSVRSASYELPDGQVICVFDQRYKCPEILFK